MQMEEKRDKHQQFVCVAALRWKLFQFPFPFYLASVQTYYLPKIPISGKFISGNLMLENWIHSEACCAARFACHARRMRCM